MAAESTAPALSDRLANDHLLRPPPASHRAPQVGVEDAMLKGRMRVTLRPLLNRVPVVGAVQVRWG